MLHTKLERERKAKTRRDILLSEKQKNGGYYLSILEDVIIDGALSEIVVPLLMLLLADQCPSEEETTCYRKGTKFSYLTHNSLPKTQLSLIHILLCGVIIVPHAPLPPLVFDISSSFTQKNNKLLDQQR